MKHVQVLLSAYNGEKYLAEQLDSILGQIGVDVSILARDDGSIDKTRDILSAYADKYENIAWYQGNNLGAQGSFFDLLNNASGQADYYAFSDQDDYWLPEKLLKAAESLQSEFDADIPLLYASKVIYASEDLQTREAFAYSVPREAVFGNALVENICMGCTEVFNRKLLDLVREHEPAGGTLHDWWLYLSASCFGKVVFDQHAYILYRQHESNQVGMQNDWGTRWRNRMRHFQTLRHSLRAQAKDFLTSYGTDFPQAELAGKVACSKIGFRARVSLVRDSRIYRQQKADNWVYHFLFLLGLL